MIIIIFFFFFFFCFADKLKNGGVTAGLMRLSQTILGATSVMQAVIPYLLEKTPDSYYASSLKTLQDNGKSFVAALSGCEGLTVVVPKAAMYCMVGIDLAQFPDFPSDVVKFNISPFSFFFLLL
jgi:tyrosine aminotransferase